MIKGNTRLVFVSIVISFFLMSTHIFAEEQKVAKVVTERPQKEIWITKKYDAEENLIEYISCRWFPKKPRGALLKRHGKSERYGKGGVVIKTQWYFGGKLVEKDKFDKLSKSVLLESLSQTKETPQDKEIKDFILVISRAWRNKDYQKCKTIIDNKLKEKPHWIPAIISRYGYLTFVERDDQGATLVLSAVGKIIREQRADYIKKNKYFEARLWRMFTGIYRNYYEQSKKGIQGYVHVFGGKVVDIEKAHESYLLFPPSDLLVAYLMAIGRKINFEDLKKEIKKKNKD